MIAGIGTDVVDLDRVVRLMATGGDRFLTRWFTPGEVAYCRSKSHPARHLAARLAAKEAVAKALRLEFDRTVPWRDIEVVLGEDQAPRIELHGTLAERTPAGGRWHVSLSHSDQHATAVAILEIDPLVAAEASAPTADPIDLATDPLSESLRVLAGLPGSTGDPQLDALRAAILIEDVADVILTDDQIDPDVLTDPAAVLALVRSRGAA